MSDVHLPHARLVDFGTLGNASLGGTVFVFAIELLMEDFFAFEDHTGLFLLVLLESHHHFLEGLLVSFLNDEILDCGVTFLILH